MSSFRLILRSITHYWRPNLAVALGVAAATAVLTGALLVGDSMRGSLRRLTLDQLGRIDAAVLPGRFFRESLAREFSSQGTVAPVILLRGSLEASDVELPRRANRIEVIGCDESFWRLGQGVTPKLPARREIVLTQPVAERLGASVGDSVLLRLPQMGPVAGDSPLGRKTDTVRSYRLTVCDILAAEGLGHFALRPSQQPPRDVFVSLAWLQEVLEQPDRVNTVLLEGATSAAHPALEDYGLHLRHSKQGYFDVTSDRMLLDDATEKAVRDALATIPDVEVQPVLTYLANWIACGKRQIPYSTVSAMDFTKRPPLGPFLNAQDKPVAPLADGQIVLNRWAADDLKAQPGDTVRLTFFEPESTHGQTTEQTIDLQLVDIVELKGAAADPGLTPEVAGVTDEESIASWDPPFPFEADRIRKKDEDYWDAHRATPKAFVSRATGRRLWASRFGQTTSLRIAVPEGVTADELRQRIAQHLAPETLGFAVRPLRQQALAASAGATPFDVLFLCLSFFVIVAALSLVSLLFRLNVDQRASQVGLLLALGFTLRKIRRLLAAEGLCVAALGSALGIAGGVGYAAVMLLGLRTWWLGAVGTPFLTLYITPTSLIIGYVAGLLVAGFVILLSLRRLARLSPRRLLAGQTTDSSWTATAAASRRWKTWPEIVWLGVLAVSVVGLPRANLPDDAQAVAFFLAGAAVLASTVLMIYGRLRRGSTRAVATGGMGLAALAVRNAARNLTQSMLCVGLVASVVFLVVAVSAFRIDPTVQTPQLDHGDGGFDLLAESDQPIFQNLNTAEGRHALGFSSDDERLLGESQIVALRVNSGDDASCLNLYQARQPRILGIPPSLVDRGGFAWAATASDTPNPWRLLEKELPLATDGTPCIPVVMEKNTANYALHLWKGPGETYDVVDGHGRTLRLQVVGLLSGSILQGDLLISEANLLRYFPTVNGYRFFLIDATPGRAPQVAAALENRLGDYGLATQTTGQRLADFLAIQNTYLSTFQSLGGLGLLLGTLGLAAVELRNVMQRRGELALLEACGFRPQMILHLVFNETFFLLLTGVATGVLAAAVAVVPHVRSQGASIPWLSLAVVVLAMLVVGVVSSLAAVGSVIRSSPLAVLRHEH